jgi:streptogramin lyase
MWFADCYPDQTCAPSTVDASGHVTEFARVGVIGAIALGPDGNAWFSGGTQNPNVYRVTPTGTITTFVVRSIGPSEAYETHAIVAGPDGNMWLAEGDRIDKITMAGVVTHYLLANYYRPQSLTLGPDGRLWFDDDPEVAAIDMSGTISHYTLSQARDTTSRAAWGSDGLLHFNAFIGGAPGGCYCTMTTAGTEGAITLAPGTGPGLGMVTGPNGNIWYVGSANVVEQGTNSTLVPTFSFVDATGRATSYPYYDPTSGVIGGQIGFQDGIANSTDGTLWAAYNGGVVKFTNDP